MSATATEITGERRAAVICIGGAGAAIASMLMERNCIADVITVNTDGSSVVGAQPDYPVVLSEESTRGDFVRAAELALSRETDLRALIRNYQYIYIVSAMGGGAGTGIAPVIAKYCRLENVEFYAGAVMPFSFEDRQHTACEGFRALHAECKENSVKFENDAVLAGADPSMSFEDVIRLADERICDSIEETIADIPNLADRKVPRTDASALLAVGVRQAVI